MDFEINTQFILMFLLPMVAVVMGTFVPLVFERIWEMVQELLGL